MEHPGADNTTLRLQRCLDRLHAGDQKAREELVNQAFHRLARLTANLSRRFTSVKCLADQDDVLQQSLARLWTTLGKITPGTVRDVFHLAAIHIRRELIDLSRKLFGPNGRGRNEQDQPWAEDSEQQPVGGADGNGEPSHLLAWTEMHEQIEQLTPELREVFELKYYHDLTQTEIAALLHITPKQVRHCWRDACLELYNRLHGYWPDL